LPFCSNCGSQLRDDTKFCSNCGYKISESELKLIGKSPKGPRSTPKKTTSDYIEAEETEEEEIEETEKDEDEYEQPDVEKYTEVEVKYKHDDGSTKEQRIQVPVGAKVKSKTPKSTSCLVCNLKTENMCYFCNFALCKEHSINMQIFADKSRFGNVIESCPQCANKKQGRQPTKEEAEGIGFFFNIKPYHEWKVLK